MTNKNFQNFCSCHFFIRLWATEFPEWMLQNVRGVTQGGAWRGGGGNFIISWLKQAPRLLQMPHLNKWVLLINKSSTFCEKYWGYRVTHDKYSTHPYTSLCRNHHTHKSVRKRFENRACFNHVRIRILQDKVSVDILDVLNTLLAEGFHSNFGFHELF